MATETNISYKEKDEEKCGCEFRCCGICKTKRIVFELLSCCANAKVLVVFLSIASFLQGFIINGLVNVGFTTIEKRFSIHSSDTALISSSYDIGVLVCLLFVTYYGARGHKALWIGGGVLLMGCGSIVYTLPHFIAPKYDYKPVGDEGENLCFNVTKDTCLDGSLRNFRGFLIAGQLLHGIGASPLFTLGITYLDENVSQRYSSSYQGVYFAGGLLGPSLGYIVGGSFLSMYINVGEKVPFTQESHLWIGAWWFGFLVFGSLAILLSGILYMFPYHLPNTDKHRENRNIEITREKIAEKVCQDETFGSSIKDFPKSILMFLKNKTIILLTLSGTMEYAFVAGTGAFGPKILEDIFSKSPTEAGFIFGIVVLVGGLLGNLLAGAIISKFRLKVVHMLRLIPTITFLAWLSTLIFLITCPNIDFAGADESSVVDSCNEDCGCSQELYSPVCASNNVTYFSPCYAGCTSNDLQNCFCINSTFDKAVKPGICLSESCGNYELFVAIMFFLVFFTMFTSIPSIQISLRCVPFTQRSFVLGCQWVLYRVLGTIPGVFIYGAVLDLACLVWGEECGKRGSCKFYDNQKISYYVFACGFVFKAVAFFLSIGAWLLYKPQKEEDTNEQNEKIWSLDDASKTDLPMIKDQNLSFQRVNFKNHDTYCEYTEF